MLKKTKVFLEMIKFEHTIFALPFAFMGAVLGSVVVLNNLPTWGQIFWIILAMVGARTAAMGLNRLIDKTIDLKNPRTSMRAIPAGLISSKEVILFIVASFALLIVASLQLHPIAIKLMPLAVFFLVIYSYTKRFTWLCHVVLGLTIGLAPLGGWVAVTGEFGIAALLLYVAIVFWIAGFDIIYACQDADYDKDEKLHSIPARFGIAGGLRIAQFFHVITALSLLSLLLVTDLGWWYAIGTGVAILILFYEHWIVSPSNLTRLNTAFFTLNGVLSIVVFVFTLIDLVVKYG